MPPPLPVVMPRVEQRSTGLSTTRTDGNTNALHLPSPLYRSQHLRPGGHPRTAHALCLGRQVPVPLVLPHPVQLHEALCAVGLRARDLRAVRGQVHVQGQRCRGTGGEEGQGVLLCAVSGVACRSDAYTPRSPHSKSSAFVWQLSLVQHVGEGCLVWVGSQTRCRRGAGDRSTDPSTPLHTPPHPSTPLHTPPQPSTALHTPPHPSTPLHAPPHPSTPLHTPPHPCTPLHTTEHPSTALHTPPHPSTPLHTTEHPSTPLHTPSHH